MYEILIMENEHTTGSSGWINGVKLYSLYNVEFQNVAVAALTGFSKRKCVWAFRRDKNKWS